FASKSQHGCIAGKDDAIRTMPLTELFDGRRHHFIRIPKSPAPAQAAGIDPASQAFAEPIGDLAAERHCAQVNIAQMGQANGSAHGFLILSPQVATRGLWNIDPARSIPYNFGDVCPSLIAETLASPEDFIPMPKVTFVKEKKEIDVPAGSNLRDEARKAGVEVHATVEAYVNCMGNGLCGTCRVLVKQGMENLSKPTTLETINLRAHPLTMMVRIGHEEELRLACQ